jgi:hypothetical protein
MTHPPPWPTRVVGRGPDVQPPQRRAGPPVVALPDPSDKLDLTNA